MSLYAEPPFNEFEERWFLAEILKHSPIAPGTLSELISQGQVEPVWTQIVPPFGRSITACQYAFSLLLSRQPPKLNFKAKNTRPSFQVRETSSLGERTIQPRPPTFPSVNRRQEQTQVGDDGQPRKKRGRPSKEEHEQRVAEAALRGEVYPPPKKIKTPRPSLDATGAVAVLNALEMSNEIDPSGLVSPASTDKKPPFKPAPERNTSDHLPGVFAESPSQMTITAAPKFATDALPLPSQQIGASGRGSPQPSERQAQKGADQRGSNEMNSNPFTSDTGHLPPSSVPLAGPSHPPSTQYR